ncbi:hypothetical protein MKW98_029568 [Papaver atlanticum]|uniref:Uncharacterized protein n=1 Tax=Papaver atlanticum TaxID=357466 RepID=A0AAD4S3C7_9MAGN|nr:hypothetical protein MKW98_029568 [Papaver atlanticum]
MRSQGLQIPFLFIKIHISKSEKSIHLRFGSVISIRAELYLKVDAFINPGNNGGPAITGDKVAGVASQKYLCAENIGILYAHSSSSSDKEFIVGGNAQFELKDMIWQSVL